MGRARGRREEERGVGWWRASQPVRLVLGLAVMTVLSAYWVFVDGDDGQRVAGGLWLTFVGAGALIMLVMTVRPSAGHDRARVAIGAGIFSAVGLVLALAAVIATSGDGSGLGIYTLPSLLAGLVGFGYFGWVAITTALGRRAIQPKKTAASS